MKHLQKTDRETYVKHLKECGQRSIKTLRQAIESPQVSALNRHCPKELRAAVVNEINKVCRLSGSDMNESIQFEAAKMLIENKWYLRIDEILLVLNNGINGHYGKVYGAINYVIIAEWFVQHEQTREAYFDEQNRNNQAGYVKEMPITGRASDKTLKEMLYLSAEDLKELEK